MGSEWAYAGGLLALVALADLEFHVLSLVEGAEASNVDFRLVHEDAVAAVLSDEAEAFFRVESFHRALGHAMFPYR